MRSEAQFLRAVREITGDARVAIFIDNIGGPVHRATLRALGRQGVITTSGWDRGALLSTNRIESCMNRHIHVHTHGMRRANGVEACQFMSDSDWIPPENPPVWSWDDIPDLAARFGSGELDSYFPVFEVNAGLA
jgi:NADPH:quinone reductase-like Zn-dependent oxidoreductase